MTINYFFEIFFCAPFRVFRYSPRQFKKLTGAAAATTGACSKNKYFRGDLILNEV
jgi:hypothetical protein